MADTTSQDILLARLNARLATCQADKSTLENIENPNADIVTTINILEKSIQRTQLQITQTEAMKADIIQKYQDNQDRHDVLGTTYGQTICDIVEKYH